MTQFLSEAVGIVKIGVGSQKSGKQIFGKCL